MEIISVCASTSYDIYIDSNILPMSGELIRKNSSSNRVAIITDDIVDGLYCSTVESSLKENGFDVIKFVFPNGEESKSHETLIKIYNFLSQNGITRSDILIALGGGVVGDITGYVAATYLRGLGFVQIPTTFLAQIDSSVGGKTGVNIDEGKNLVGAFYQPLCVICDTSTLSTLSEEIFADGVAEAVKYGMIESEELFDKMHEENIGSILNEVIFECISIKRDIVELDELDKGERMKLNFGHTLGHAIEKYYNYRGITHGRAVAIGMCEFTKLAEKYGMCDNGVVDRLIACLERYSLPTSTEINMDALAKLCMSDKKRDNDKINIVYCESIGKSTILPLTIEEFYKFLKGDYQFEC